MGLIKVLKKKNGASEYEVYNSRIEEKIFFEILENECTDENVLETLSEDALSRDVAYDILLEDLESKQAAHFLIKEIYFKNGKEVL